MSSTDRSDPVHMMFCGNEGAALGLCVSIGSALAARKTPRQFVIHIMDTGISESSREKISRFVSDFENAVVQFHDIDLDPFKKLNPWGNGGWTTYSKMLLGRYINARRVVYFDPDFLINKDPSELYDMDMDDCTAMAVRTPTIPYLSSDCPWIPTEECGSAPYFNAGLIVFDVEKWKQNGCEDKIMKLVDRGGGILHFAIRHC